MFPVKKFAIPYKEEEFPLFVEQKRLFLEVSVMSDKRLSIIADRCYTTPTRERENAQRYEFISKGWAKYLIMFLFVSVKLLNLLKSQCSPWLIIVNKLSEMRFSPKW